MTQFERSETPQGSEIVEAKRLSLKPRSRKQRQNSPISLEHDSQTVTLNITASIAPSMSGPTRLLVCSIGNPAPYLNTLHSAGHVVLSALATALSYPAFRKSRAYGKGLVSAGSEFTLWQSSSLMNISGVGVAAAWLEFLKDARGEETKLIVVHDELELGLGQVNVKSGSLSAKGHNGLKSIKELLKGVEYTRIGVGIGRPGSREPDVVAGYVLRKMSPEERIKVEACTGRVEAELRRLSGT